MHMMSKPNEPVHIISLGAGVQSSTMALMAACGELTPMPIAAIFADTQAEPPSVYRWLDWLEKQLPFQVYRVSKGNLQRHTLTMKTRERDGAKFSKCDLPFYTLSATGKKGMVLQRSCTRTYKIAPITKQLKALVRPKRKSNIVAISWIGISRDEVERMKPSRAAWIENIWPLIDKRLSRDDCKHWMLKHGYPLPPRSACYFCPFHNNEDWRALKTNEPSTFLAAVQFEKDYQNAKASTSKAFLHPSCKPLDQIDFRSEEDKGQGNLFINECEGMCGV